MNLTPHPMPPVIVCEVYGDPGIPVEELANIFKKSGFSVINCECKGGVYEFKLNFESKEVSDP